MLDSGLVATPNPRQARGVTTSVPLRPSATPDWAHSPLANSPLANREQAKREQATPERAPLPPVGPAWYGSVMGTGMLATLLQMVGGHHVPALAPLGLLLLGWLLLVGLSVGFVGRVVTRPGTLRASVTVPAQFMGWGMVSMGVLSIGSATATVLPAHWPAATALAWRIDGALWLIGTALGWAAALYFLWLMRSANTCDATFTWGLPGVAPMVTATTGAVLSDSLPAGLPRLLVLLASGASFALALGLGVTVFVLAYSQHWTRARLADSLAPTAWIPLGIVGQSTAAADSLAGRLSALLSEQASADLTRIAQGYGLTMLALGVPLAGWAAWRTARAFAAHIGFTPAWWSLTFPVGTLSLGSHLLGARLDSPVIQAVPVATLVCLVGTWTIAATGTVQALARLSRGWAPRSANA